MVLAVLSHTLQWSKYSIVGNVVWASFTLLCLSSATLTPTNPEPLGTNIADGLEQNSQEGEQWVMTQICTDS